MIIIHPNIYLGARCSMGPGSVHLNARAYFVRTCAILERVGPKMSVFEPYRAKSGESSLQSTANDSEIFHAAPGSIAAP